VHVSVCFIVKAEKEQQEVFKYFYSSFFVQLMGNTHLAGYVSVNRCKSICISLYNKHIQRIQYI